MTAPMAPIKTFDLLPENAPFTPEQRVWLSGFFAGYLGLDTQAVTALSPGQAEALINPPAEEEDAPWHDPAMAIADRMKLAEGRSTKAQLFAAMAQQNCGQCGYLCRPIRRRSRRGRSLASTSARRPQGHAARGETDLETAGAAPAAEAKPAEAAPAAPKGYSRDNRPRRCSWAAASSTARAPRRRPTISSST